MDELQTSSEHKLKSGDNWKQIIIGILLLSVIVYVTFGLISKKFGWDVKPTPVAATNSFKPEETKNIASDIIENNRLVPEQTNTIQADKKENNLSQSKTIPAPVVEHHQEPKPVNQQTLVKSKVQSSVINPPEESKSKTIKTLVSLSGKWQTDDNETWDITMDGENVTIRVYDKKNKYKNLMTGKLSGEQVILTNEKPGSKGEGILFISNDGKTMRGKIKFIIARNNYVVTRIDS